MIGLNRNRKEQYQVQHIAIEANIYCSPGCNHIFCIKSLGNVTFDRKELFGAGGFGKIYKRKISNTDRVIAIKRIKDNSEDKKNIEGNINKYLSLIRHENIVRYFGALAKFGKLFIYMEFMPEGSLGMLIVKKGYIELNQVIAYTSQILNGIKFLHLKNIIHRDIKPDNMLIDRGIIKLTDFGFSKVLDFWSKNIHSVHGTTQYLAPEIFDEKYSFPVDIWSTGISIIHMILGKLPGYWCEPIVFEEFIRFTDTNIQPTFYKLTELMVAFINGVLTVDVDVRPTAECLLQNQIFNE